LGDECVQLKRPLLEDPHLIATMKTYNEKVGFGADGMCFDSKGNLFVGNFADGTVHKVAFDAQGNPQPAVVFARAPFMKSCDGLFCDPKTDWVYVADSLANAVQIVMPDGKVCTLAQDPEGDGTDGRMDQPCEVLLRGREVIVSNFDFPVPGGVNTKFEVPNTLCRIPLD
jgi:sugar lactone lactonase YvrE